MINTANQASPGGTIYDPSFQGQYLGNRSSGSKGIALQFTLTILDDDLKPQSFCLDSSRQMGKIYFGRIAAGMTDRVDIPLKSGYVSRGASGSFEKTAHGWVIRNEKMSNGMILGDRAFSEHLLQDGDCVRIGMPKGNTNCGVMMLFTADMKKTQWSQKAMQSSMIIGRDGASDICLPHVTVSKKHARIRTNSSGAKIIEDLGSTNGVFVNGNRVQRAKVLRDKDVITITSTTMIYTNAAVYWHTNVGGISVKATDVVVKRGKGSSAKTTLDHASVSIEPGELVAMVGGSGAGKSTLLNVLSGYLKPVGGHVWLNGVDLYKNFDALKKIIGYVPQSDIVYDNLTLTEMLDYTAKLRLPADISETERKSAIDRAIAAVELQEHKDKFIRNLSGGQRKRASIAVELLSDPNLIFLDEPTSGLDPWTEKSLMATLRKMTEQGKTVILVTHSTLQLDICDKVVFMGKNGKLCFSGPLRDVFNFFKVSNVVDVYGKITNETDKWRNAWLQLQHAETITQQEAATNKQKRDKAKLGVLCSRYLTLTLHDKMRVIVLLGMVPLIILMLSLVVDDTLFQSNGYSRTHNILFALACSCFFLGVFSSVSEVSKERVILKREYMTGLSLNAYVLSKMVILGLICLVQSVMMMGLFSIFIGLPEEGIFLSPFQEMLITTFLLEFSSAATGLLVSCIVKKPDLGTTLTVILLLPQILFSGTIFKLTGSSETLSYLTSCRWGMEGYGSIAGLQGMSSSVFVEGQFFNTFPGKGNQMFECSSDHLIKAWLILGLIAVICMIASRIALEAIRKD